MIVVTLVLAGIVWLIVIGVERTSKAPIAAGLTGLGVSIFMMFLLMFGSAALFLVGILMFVTGCFCSHFQLSGRKFAMAMLATIPVAMVCVSIASWERVAQYRDLQAKYRFESLAERLAYETRAVSPTTARLPMAMDSLSVETGSMIDEIDRHAHEVGYYRTAMLHQLHERQLDAFANSPGFGVTRGVRFYSESQLVTEPRPPIAPAAAPEVPYRPVPSERSDAELNDIAQVDIVANENGNLGLPVPNTVMASATSPAPDRLKELHRSSAIDFVNPLGFGLVESRHKVAGFEPHAFSKLPELHRSGIDDAHAYLGERGEPDPDWLLVSLQLVSMLKHETPVIYATNELPRMEALRSDDIPTRPLDAFEADALPKVKQGEMLVVEQGLNRIRMLGAVRAGEKCIECHSVPRNALLGAFSYELVRKTPVVETLPVIERPEL